MVLCAKQMIPFKSFGLLCMISCSVFLPFGCLVYPRNCLFISCRERVWCTSIQQPHCAKEFVLLSENLCCYQSFVLLSEVRIVETWDLPPATEVTQCKVGEGQTRTTSSKMHNFYTHYHLHNCLYGNCGNCANWNFQANKILFRGCEVSHYDSGVDNDEKEGDRRTKQDV